MEQHQFVIVLKARSYSLVINGRDALTWLEFGKRFTEHTGLQIDQKTKLSFSTAGQQNCILGGEADYVNMMLLCSITKQPLITITISEHTIQGNIPSAAESQTDISGFFRAKKNTNPTVKHTFDLNKTPAEHDHALPYGPDGGSSFTLGDRQFHYISASTERQSAEVAGTDTPNFSTVPCNDRPNQNTFQTPGSAPLLADDLYFSKTTIEPGLVNKCHPHTNHTEGDGVSKCKKRNAQIDIGEFFPSYEISPQQDPVMLRSANWVTYIRHVGQEFKGGVTEFRSKLIMYSSKIGFKFHYLRNDAVYVYARCAMYKSEACAWFIKGATSSVTETFIIKDADLRHTCTLSIMGPDSQRIGCRIIGDLITDAIRAKPTLTATQLKKDLLTYYGFTVPYEKVWRGIEVARANVFGGYADSFDELRWYHQAILRTNPGSEVFLETDKANRFHRFFLAFNASLEGFKKCRPMLFVDGTFMKTKYKGTLLAATAKDGNNGLFPVAIAIVEGENTDNWMWFIKKIRDLVHHPQEIMFVSDRAGGLMSAFDDVYEKPLHFFCLYHLMQNLRAMYKGKKYSDVYKSSMCKLLREAAYAPTKQFYEIAIHKFKLRGGEVAHHFLNDLPPEKWAIAFAPDVHRYGELTSNAAESFNSWILEARSLPITFMIDCIRMKMMQWFAERREEGNKWTGALTKRAQEMWNLNDSLGDSWDIHITNVPGVYEVVSPTSCVVDLNKKTCSCYQWQIRGFPCCHAIGVIKRSKWHIRQVVDSCFFTDTYLEIYAENIYPIPSTEKFEVLDLNGPSVIQPPIIRRQAGRPRNKRFRVDSSGKKQREFICGRCGEYGTHIWTTCKEALYE